MDKIDVLKLANQAFDESSFTDAEVLRFAALVMEECARICDENPFLSPALSEAAAAIRAAKPK